MSDLHFEPDLEGLRRAVDLIADYAASAGHPLPAEEPRPFVSLTTVYGESWLRSVAANPNADPDPVVDAVLAALHST